MHLLQQDRPLAQQIVLVAVAGAKHCDIEDGEEHQCLGRIAIRQGPRIEHQLAIVLTGAFQIHLIGLDIGEA